MRLSSKQNNEIKIIEWFIPEWVLDWNGAQIKFSDSTVFSWKNKKGKKKVKNIRESPNSKCGPEEAFLMRSESGRFPNWVRDKGRLRSLLWGKIWRERHLSEIWILDGTLFPQDFLEEPEYIREFIFPRVFGLPRNWNLQK